MICSWAGDKSPLSFLRGCLAEGKTHFLHSFYFLLIISRLKKKQLPAAIYTLVKQTVLFVVALEIENGMPVSGEIAPLSGIEPQIGATSQWSPKGGSL